MEQVQRKDIQTDEDIKRLVDTFYQKVNLDTLLSPIFNQVVKVDWASHLPKMYDFWNMIVFGSRNFQGNPMGVHIHLSTITNMGEHEFRQWIELFNTTMDELFEGINANEAKSRAQTIATTMMYKIKQQKSEFKNE